ncbi:YchF/TatD family DNA exonuclease [Candidatus Bathyarchaeota archaeon]|nr:YchF/TatD family DNA exonuclease [Candidatus Bathyarchaeota archaeon]
MLIDSHAHLQWPSFNRDREEVISRARRAGVNNIVNVGTDLENSMLAVEIAEKHNGIYATAGIHPHNASQSDEQTMSRLQELSRHPKVVAIGEMGLDYYRNLSPRRTQKRVFESQLSLAAELGLPVVIHNRDAHSDVLRILSKHGRKVNGVMHCFSGNLEMAEQCIQLNFALSFAGSLTYPNSDTLREVVRQAPLRKILLETDSPWLAPQDVRGRRNEPAFLLITAKKIAKLKEVSIAKLAAVTRQNFEEVFKITLDF